MNSEEVMWTEIEIVDDLSNSDDMNRDQLFALSVCTGIDQKFLNALRRWLNDYKNKEDLKVIEVMAGRGLLGHYLGDIVMESSDNFSWLPFDINRDQVADEVVEKDSIKAVAEFEPDIVIMAWPEPDTNTAFDVIKTLHHVTDGKGKVIFIGMPSYDLSEHELRTANSLFYDHFVPLEDDFNFHEEVNGNYYNENIGDEVIIGEFSECDEKCEECTKELILNSSCEEDIYSNSTEFSYYDEELD